MSETSEAFRPKRFVLRQRFVLAEKFDGTQECAERLCMWMTDKGFISTIHKGSDGKVFIALHRKDDYWLHPGHWLVWQPDQTFATYADTEFTGVIGKYDEDTNGWRVPNQSLEKATA